MVGVNFWLFTIILMYVVPIYLCFKEKLVSSSLRWIGVVLVIFASWLGLAIVILLSKWRASNNSLT